MLEILRKELVGNIVSFYELDEIMIKHGYQSELAWINDEGLWDDILKDKNICYKIPDSDEHFAISFEIESKYNSEEESADCTLVNIVNIEVQ
jgi:hypothetical protein